MFHSDEYKFLDIENKVNLRTQLSSQAFQKYSKVLNNLLGINNRSDYAVFTKLNSFNVDLLKRLKRWVLLLHLFQSGQILSWYQMIYF